MNVTVRLVRSFATDTPAGVVVEQHQTRVLDQRLSRSPVPELQWLHRWHHPWDVGLFTVDRARALRGNGLE